MEKMAGSLLGALGPDRLEKSCMEVLVISKWIFIQGSNLTIWMQKISKGLNEAHPFNENSVVDQVLQEAEEILSLCLDAIGAKHAAQIWAFILKFVMLDCFSAVLGAMQVHPGLLVPRRICSPEYLGTGARVKYLHWSTLTLLTQPSDPWRP